ncbi:MAG: hypothetical protein CM15mP120_11480 [Pseudomonadota bacterium]|nr:MAG: hypothetical protein CM15mP120_11480 [Pseudomonadota bacterium]
MPLRAHFHDTRNTGIANAYAALMAGVSVWMPALVVSEVVPLRRTPAVTCATEDLVYMLSRGAIEHGVN